MPNAAETVEAPYTAAERLTFLPQPARLPSNLSETVLSTLSVGGPFFTVDRTVFELRLGAL